MSNKLKPQDGDIGLDAADRLYKYVFFNWVTQSESSSPVYPIKIITRWYNGEYKPVFTQADVTKAAMALRTSNTGDVDWNACSDMMKATYIKDTKAALNTVGKVEE